MKTLTTLTAVAALMAGMAVASAQNPAGKGTPTASPADLNKGATESQMKSGSQTDKAAKSTKDTMPNAMKSEAPPSNAPNAGVRTGTGDAKSGDQSKASANMKDKSAKPMATTGTEADKNPPPNAPNAGVRTGSGDSKSGMEKK